MPILGEWEHFLYVSKIALVGWALHYCEYSIVLTVRGEADARKQSPS